jgi:hypothetical protein
VEIKYFQLSQIEFGGGFKYNAMENDFMLFIYFVENRMQILKNLPKLTQIALLYLLQ